MANCIRGSRFPEIATLKQIGFDPNKHRAGILGATITNYYTASVTTQTDGLGSWVGHNGGKYYFEAQPTFSDSMAMSMAMGIATGAYEWGDPILQDDDNGVGYGYLTNGRTGHQGTLHDYTASHAVTSGEWMGCAADFNTGKLWFRDSAGWVSGDPAAGTSPDWAILPFTQFYIVCTLPADNQSWLLNAGQSAFAYTIPSGFSAWES